MKDTEESEDESWAMGDLYQPGFGGLLFGNFDSGEIKKLTCMSFLEGSSITINEYGSNMGEKAFDSLAAIEAKRALLKHEYSQSDLMCSCLKERTSSKRKDLSPVLEEK